MNRHIPFPSHREYRFYQGLFATGVANGIQALNFLGDRFLRKSRSSAGIDELYRHAVDSAFSPKQAFLVTGAPHASAYYPRDFAWFYPDVLDPGTIMDFDDAIRRVRLLEKSVRLMLEAVRADVVTTTIVPAGGDRYIGVNYFSRPSDTLLGILAGLEQIISADQRTSLVSGDVARRACRPSVACRVSRGSEEGDFTTRGSVGAVRGRRHRRLAV